ncbi:MAG: iron ABC transporter permease [Phycisphaeraceae bacterium]|nr:iron ABC transporter permease [Phycisphaeraceae bacterium]
MVALLGITLIYPILLTIRGGFVADVATGRGWSLEPLSLLFRDPTRVAGLLNAAKVAITTTFISILIGLPLAVLSVRYTFPGKKLLQAGILIPLILPPFVGAIGLQMIIGRTGSLNTLLGTDWDILGSARFWGVVIVEALHLYPIIYLNATAALANIDPAMEEAAESLGASPWQRLRTITLPLIRSGIFAGATIVLIWSFTELGTPLVFEYRVITPVQIFDGLKQVENSAEPYALTFVLLACAVGMYLVGKLMFGGRGYEMQSKASRASTETALSPTGGIVATCVFAFVTFIALVPHLGVILTSISEPWAWYRSVLPKDFTSQHYQTALSDPLAFGSIINSLTYSSLAVVLNLGLGLLAGYLIARTKVRGRNLLDAMCMLPLAVPGLVMAFGYIAATLRWPFGDGPLGSIVSVFGNEPNPLPILVIAYAVRRLPYIVRSTVSGLEQTSVSLEEAAINLGATKVGAFRRIVIPLIMANLIAGSLLVFSFSMLEVSDSLLLAQKESDYPVTKAIYTFANRLADGQFVASAMGVWGMILLTVTLVGASLLIGKKLGATFRV